MSALNPLDHVFETEEYPHARTHRTSFGRKIIDTFETFAGYPSPTKPGHAGIFDYLTLGIPILLYWINFELIAHARSTAARIALTVPLVLISGPLMLARVIFAAALTFACLPFIGLAQLITSREGDKLKNKINNFEVTEQPVDTATGLHPSLGALLRQANTNLDDIAKVENINDIPPGMDAKDAKAEMRQLRFFKSDTREPAVEFKLNLNADNHKKVFNALRKLNIGGIQYDIEHPARPTL